MPPILASSITLIPFVAFLHTFTLPFHGRCPSRLTDTVPASTPLLLYFANEFNISVNSPAGTGLSRLTSLSIDPCTVLVG